MDLLVVFTRLRRKSIEARTCQRWPLVLVVVTLFAAIPSAASADSLSSKLGQAMNHAARASGAWVYNLDTQQVVFERRPRAKRILASNQKLLTSAAAVTKWSADSRIQTTVVGSGRKDGTTWKGDIYLKGYGDPLLATDTFADRQLGGSATRLSALAETLADQGIDQITGRVYGDESFFDTRRGPPSSNYNTSFYVGPLSALALNTGHSDLAGRAFQTSPASFAADRFVSILKERGIELDGQAQRKSAPSDVQPLATVESDPLAAVIKRMNKSSNNYIAEMLIKRLGADFGGQGSTASGAKVIEDFANQHSVEVRARDGSGLARANKASPRSVGILLKDMRADKNFTSYRLSLAIAGRDGTLKKRMRSGPARGRVRAKTGTLNGVSTLSGYVDTVSGDSLVFSVLINSTSTYSAHSVQDRMAQLMAGS